MAEHRGGSGNFAEDREKASDAGRKGGQHSGGEDQRSGDSKEFFHGNNSFFIEK